MGIYLQHFLFYYIAHTPRPLLPDSRPAPAPFCHTPDTALVTTKKLQLKTRFTLQISQNKFDSLLKSTS